MYSRYKIQMPAPPPDYAGTAFKTDASPRSAGSASDEISPAASGSPIDSGAENRREASESPREDLPEIRWESPAEMQPEAPLDPDYTLSPEEEFGENRPTEPDSEPEAGGKAPEDSESAPKDEDAGSLFAHMNPDDLLFIGAMLYLLSGKNGNDSFLLLAYLLTCGL